MLINTQATQRANPNLFCAASIRLSYKQHKKKENISGKANDLHGDSAKPSVFWRGACPDCDGKELLDRHELASQAVASRQP
jgi:hypothetical protein